MPKISFLVSFSFTQIILCKYYSGSPTTCTLKTMWLTPLTWRYLALYLHLEGRLDFLPDMTFGLCARYRCLS